jgi:molybdenum cofactor biosynthesis enzyme MoaA
MACKNCYIPRRDLPDLPVEFLYNVLNRLPQRCQVRLAGAEPTLRTDLPEIIAKIRAIGHIPYLLTNGLKLGRERYARQLKDAGLRSLHISMNGGLSDALYKDIDNLHCAERKLHALDTLLGMSMHVTVGMILVRKVNDSHLAEFIAYLLTRNVKRIHLRSVGEIGDFIDIKPLSLDELECCTVRAAAAAGQHVVCTASGAATRDYLAGTLKIHVTCWPELGSLERGRVAPDGYLEPMFESIISNAGLY